MGESKDECPACGSHDVVVGVAAGRRVCMRCGHQYEVARVARDARPATSPVVTREHRHQAVLAVHGKIREDQFDQAFIDGNPTGEWNEDGKDWKVLEHAAQVFADFEALVTARLRERLASAHGLIESLQRELRERG
jgi:transcription elongation factor Elf1